MARFIDSLGLLEDGQNPERCQSLKYTKRLHLDEVSMTDQSTHILLQCFPNLATLTIWDEVPYAIGVIALRPILTGIVTTCPIEHLTTTSIVTVQHLISQLEKTPKQTDPSSQESVARIPRLTHLLCVDMLQFREPTALTGDLSLNCLPNLTHVAFHSEQLSIYPNIVSMLNAALASATSRLQCCAIIGSSAQAQVLRKERFHDHPNVVVVDSLLLDPPTSGDNESDLAPLTLEEVFAMEERVWQVGEDFKRTQRLGSV
jgi:hypothetical protein